MHDDRMSAALKFTDADTGRQWVVDLTLVDVRNLTADLVELLFANEIQVRRWWQTLADGSDGRPKARANEPRYVPQQHDSTNSVSERRCSTAASAEVRDS